MPSLKSLKLRIKSVKSTQKITKAMKMVAASKLKRAREAAEAAVPYADRMKKVMNSLAATAQTNPGEISLLTGTGKDKVHLLIIASSDRGLCGAFNGSVIKAARLKIASLEAEGKTIRLICIGKKAYDSLKILHAKKIICRYEGIGRKGIQFSDSHRITEKILELFEQQEFDFCHIIFNKFQSAISQLVTTQQLIPLTIENSAESDASPYEFEPEEETIIQALLPKNVAVQIYRALLESNASEQGARMTAMDNATRNSGEIIKKLTLVYNRTRQAHITKELIEIISGAEAV